MTELARLLTERIRREGPLPFGEVMQAALYHPTYGYYTRLRGFGADGDFITSPERHPAFGWLLGRQALDVWEALGRPQPFRILELGAGSGALAAPLVAFLRASMLSDYGHGIPSARATDFPSQGSVEDVPPAPTLTYTIDETSPSLRALQQARLADPAFRWDGADEPAHFIIANEVADALPVHRVVVRGGRCRELCVGLDEREALTWVEMPGPSDELDAYFAALDYLPPAGSVVDVCLDLQAWVKGVARRLERNGVALILDYTASPPRDSLLTYYRHTMGSDPLVRLGEQDISAHVDLRTLVRLAIAEDLRAGATSQRSLLLNLGLGQIQPRLTGPTDRQALAHLADPNGLGGQIAAVFFLRGLPAYRPVGGVGRADWPSPERVPSLPPDQDESDFLSQWYEAFGQPEPAEPEAG